MTRSRVCLFIVFFTCGSLAFSQSIQREAFVNAAHTGSNPSVILSSSLGELMVETFSAGPVIITQGFLQDDPAPVSTGISSSIQGTLRLFPNPFISVISITSGHADLSKASIEVSDALGRIQILPAGAAFPAEGKTMELRLEHLGPGVYFIRIADPDHDFAEVFKVTKIR